MKVSDSSVIVILNTQIQKPVLSRAFWVAFCICYFSCFMALYGIMNIPQGTFDSANSLELRYAYKLNAVRANLLVLALIAFPALLLTTLKWSKVFAIIMTGWAIAMYIDDHLILYALIEYPKQPVIVAFQMIRPILIISLIWMSFELHVRHKVMR